MQGLKNVLDRDDALIQNLKMSVSKEMKNAELALRFMELYQQPHHSNAFVNHREAFEYGLFL
jgi:hypothetical protein